VRRGKKIRATTAGRDGQRAGDLLRRDFTAPAPNRRWVADFTYVAAWSGIVYVAFVVDVYSRAIVGWSAATHKRTKLVLDALQMALWRRGHDGHQAPARSRGRPGGGTTGPCSRASRTRAVSWTWRPASQGSAGSKRR